MERKYRLTLYGKTYISNEEGYTEAKTSHTFNCDCLVQLLDLITDMVKTVDGELDFSIGRRGE